MTTPPDPPTPALTRRALTRAVPIQLAEITALVTEIREYEPTDPRVAARIGDLQALVAALAAAQAELSRRRDGTGEVEGDTV